MAKHSILEGLRKWVYPKLGEIGGSPSGGTQSNAGWGNAGVTPLDLVVRSEESGQEK